MASPKRARQCASVPHRNGEGSPGGGGGRYRRGAEEKAALKLSGVKLVSPILPPERQTRSNSCAVWAWSGAYMAPNVERIASKDASGKGKIGRASCRERG